jgi:hypothetical protein
MATGSALLLTKQQHSDLSSIAQSRSLPAGYVFRAKLILMLAEGASFNAIKQRLQTTAPTCRQSEHIAVPQSAHLATAALPHGITRLS